MRTFIKLILRKLKAYIILSRPKQWIKNVFVFAALVFSNNLFNISLLETTIFTSIIFCAASIFVYILNDLVDAERDKYHPKKQNRPIASNLVSKWEAIIIIVFLLPIIIYFSYTLNKYFTLIILAYLLNNLLYSFILKRIVIVDAMSIAFGFILRVVAGAAVIDVELSPWILLCTFLISLFIGFSKRRNELVLLEFRAESHREILQHYSLQFIDHILSTTTSLTVIAYSIYTFSAHSNSYMMLTIPFVLYGIFRYQYLIYIKRECGNPEEIFLSDKPLILDSFFWVCMSIFIIYKTR